MSDPSQDALTEHAEQADREELAVLERRAQDKALGEVERASLTLGAAEDVFRQAVDGMERAIHDAASVGVSLDVAKRRALANDALHALARGQVLVIIADELGRGSRTGALDAAEVAVAVIL